jgi:hypothetical protein
MKQIIITLMFFGLFGCGQKEKSFSDSEKKLIQENGFDEDAIIDIKGFVKNEFFQFEISEPGYMIGEDGEPKKTGVEKRNGLSFKIQEEKTDEIIYRFKDKLRQTGYLIFLSERGYESPSTISIVKSTDQFDILKIQKTDGINYDIENEDVIKTLKGWDSTYGIEILGADYDWVDLIIKKPVDDYSQFAKEVYEFCPDAVDQGVGEIEELEKIIKEYNRLFLWWD